MSSMAFLLLKSIEYLLNFPHPFEPQVVEKFAQIELQLSDAFFYEGQTVVGAIPEPDRVGLRVLGNLVWGYLFQKHRM